MAGISIIIPVYNRENFLAEAIQSALNQEYDDIIEIIISDDGSTDKSLEIADSFGDKVIVLRKPLDCKTQGASSTRNRGIIKATQPYICLLDSDDYYLPGHLKALATILDENPMLDFGFCRIMEKIEIYSASIYKKWTKKNITKLNIKYPVISGNNIVCTNSFIFRKHIFDSVGYFNESYSNGEDADMWLRIGEKFSGGFTDHFGAVRRKHGQNQLTFNTPQKIRENHFNVYKSALYRCRQAENKDRYRIYKLKLRILKYKFYKIRIVAILEYSLKIFNNFIRNKRDYYRGIRVLQSNNLNDSNLKINNSDSDIRFIINTSTFWHEPPRARHQVTRALAKYNKLLFIAANHIGFPKIELIKMEKNIFILQPYFPIDFRIRYRLPIINELYQRWLFKKVKNRYGDKVIINFDFTAHLLFRFFSKIVYYCNDNYTSISKKLNIWPIYKYHVSTEKKLVSGAKFCVGTSSIIVANLKLLNPFSYEILLGGPNINDFDIVPAQIKNQNTTINIGLVGFIRNYNLSYHLLNEILSNLDCTITLIGPVEPDFYNHLIDPARVRVKGILTDLPLLQAVNEFDVAIAPYLDRKIEEGGMPNKLFIYLALGKPVVMTELLSLKHMNLPDRLVYLVKKSTQFPELILKAHTENNLDLIQKRIQLAQENTWDVRIGHFIKLLKKNYCY